MWRSASAGFPRESLKKAERRGREQRAKHRTRLSRESRRFLGGRSRVVDLAEMSEKESPHPRKHALLGGLARLSRDPIALLGSFAAACQSPSSQAVVAI